MEFELVIPAVSIKYGIGRYCLIKSLKKKVNSNINHIHFVLLETTVSNLKVIVMASKFVFVITTKASLT